MDIRVVCLNAVLRFMLDHVTVVGNSRAFRWQRLEGLDVFSGEMLKAIMDTHFDDCPRW